jgi:hypothetical protein
MRADPTAHWAYPADNENLARASTSSATATAVNVIGQAIVERLETIALELIKANDRETT